MFAAKSNDKYEMFSMILNSVVENKSTFKELVDEILFETYELLNKTKNYYTISRENFDIIIFLEKNAESIIKGKTKYTTEDYANIKKVVEKELYLEY